MCEISSCNIERVSYGLCAVFTSVLIFSYRCNCYASALNSKPPLILNLGLLLIWHAIAIKDLRFCDMEGEKYIYATELELKTLVTSPVS